MSSVASSRGTPPRTDPDDWWASTGLPAPDAGPRGGEDDDWLEGERPRRPRRPVALPERRIVVGIAVVAAVVVLVLGLLVAGVFSGNAAKRASTTTGTSPGTTTAAVTTPSAPRAPAPAAALKPGATGAQVKRLQRALAVLGFSVGKVDGVYGPATVAALQRFQRAHKLAADGVLGPKTLAALRLALRS